MFYNGISVQQKDITILGYVYLYVHKTKTDRTKIRNESSIVIVCSTVKIELFSVNGITVDKKNQLRLHNADSFPNECRLLATMAGVGLWGWAPHVSKDWIMDDSENK